MTKCGLVRELVNMDDCARLYLGEPDRTRFYRCPFHTEKTPSAKVMPDKKKLHCFGCGRTWDVISFVMEYSSLSFMDAIRKIDADFSLGLFDRPTIRQQINRDRIARDVAQRKKKEQERREAEEAKFRVLEEWISTDRDIRDKAPRLVGEALHPDFARALHRRDYLEFLLDVSK